MTTTPTIWKPGFLVNSGATSGSQSVPQTIGLTNGNFLVVWEDDTNGPGPFIDIMGRLYNAAGVAIGSAYQINSAVVASDETGPRIVAMPDGGYVVAYGGYFEALGGFIGIERFDANGSSLASRFITDPMSSLTEFDITVDSLGNYTIVYERLAPHVINNITTVYSQDIFSRTYDGLTNAAGPENSRVAQNSSVPDELGAIATFANGHMVTFYNEPDYDFFNNRADTAEYSIIDPVSGTQIRNPVEIDGPDWDDDAIALDVACLAYGPFVLLYRFNDSYAFRIGESDAPGSPMSSRNTVATFGALGGARVVALNEGGFFIAWLESTAHILYGQRYAATGSPIGTLLIMSTNVSSIGQSDMTLTSDGRVLVPFRDMNGEINQMILDVRDNTIYGTDNGEQLTTQTTSTVIYGRGGNDTIYGRDGGDRMDGGSGVDRLEGGNGSDQYILSDADRSSDYSYDIVVENADAGVDTVEVMSFYRESASSAVPASYSLTDNVESGTILGTEIFQLSGNALNNTLRGNSANNVLDGKAGTDGMFGRQGNDMYFVDNAGDYIFEITGEGTADRVLTSVSYALASGQEIELFSTTNSLGTSAINLTGNAVSNTILGNNGVNIINGGAGIDRMTGLNGNDLYNVDNFSDSVAEAAGGGSADRVLTSVNYILADNQQIELFSTNNSAGIAAINLVGNNLANRILGNNGANVIGGGLANDFMTGGLGADQFRFSTAITGGGNVDTISDFVHGTDDMQLAQSIFTGIGGALNVNELKLGTVATTATERIIYNSANGALFFDTDGSGAATQTQFAIVTAGTVLDVNDFIMI